MQRLDNRKNNQLREVSIIPDFNIHAEGSALVLCCDRGVRWAVHSGRHRSRVPPAAPAALRADRGHDEDEDRRLLRL